MEDNINFEANLKAIGAVLAANDIHYVTISYSGSGDSGDAYDTTAYSVDGYDIPVPKVEVVCEHRVWGGQAGYKVEASPMDLDSAISDALNHAIEAAGYNGWENNEGGEGTLTIFASGYAELKHTEFYESDSISDTVEYDSTGPFGATLAAFAAVMKEHGCVKVQGEYSGSGDSGDGFEVYFFGPEGKGLDEEIEEDVTYPISREEHKGNGQFEKSQVMHTASFEQAMEDVCFQMVSASGHDGWENNEGGGGTFTIHDDGTAELEHYDNGETDSNSTTTSWNEELRQEGDETEED